MSKLCIFPTNFIFKILLFLNIVSIFYFLKAFLVAVCVPDEAVLCKYASTTYGLENCSMAQMAQDPVSFILNSFFVNHSCTANKMNVDFLSQFIIKCFITKIFEPNFKKQKENSSDMDIFAYAYIL